MRGETRNDLGGVWVTIKGTHVFIKDGQTGEEALAYKKNGNIKEPIDGDMFNAERFSENLKEDKGFHEIIESIGDAELEKKVAETEEKCAKLVSTYDRHWISGRDEGTVFDEARAKKQTEWVNDYFNNEEYVGKNAQCKEGEKPTLILLGGRGGSGKSNFEGLVYDRNNFCKIDADDVKKLIPEYKEWNAVQVHEESSYLTKKIIARAKDSRMNIVIDQTMSSLDSSQKYLDMFKKAGYRIEAHYMFLPPQESVKRAMTRFRDDGKKGKFTGRFVPTKILMNMKENEKVFDKIKGQVDNWSFYSNYGVNKGSKPILISKKVIE